MRPWCCAGLPNSLGEATRRASGGRTVGAPIGCRELRSAAECGSVLPEPGAVHRQGTTPGAGSQHWTVHTTQGTSVGPADTGKPAGLVTRRRGQPLGPPGTSTSSRSNRSYGVPVRGVARRGLNSADIEGESAQHQAPATGEPVEAVGAGSRGSRRAEVSAGHRGAGVRRRAQGSRRR